jgi:hypothetical protein
VLQLASPSLNSEETSFQEPKHGEIQDHFHDFLADSSPAPEQNPRNHITLNNSLLECVDQFGDKFDGCSDVSILSQREPECQALVPTNQHISYINHNVSTVEIYLPVNEQRKSIASYDNECVYTSSANGSIP